MIAGRLDVAGTRAPLRLGYVSYGDCADPMPASGIPYYLREGMRQVSGAAITEINSRPHAVERLALKAISARPDRRAWERQYLHGRGIARARSRLRDDLVRAGGPLDALLHVRTWYSPSPVPYASFIDATVTMVRGYDDSWDLSARQFRDEVAVEKRFYQEAEVMFTASHAAGDDLVETYGVRPDRIVHVGAGATLPGIEDLPDALVAERWERPSVLFVGKDPVRKGLPELVEGIRRAREEIPDLNLTVVGPTAMPGAAEERWISHRGLVTDKGALSAIYRRSSALALPAHRESYGLVVPEALSYGLPCLVSSTGELPHLVTDGAYGAVLAEVTPAAIAEGLVAMFTDPAAYAEQSRRARAASTRHDWAAIARLMVDEISSRLR